MYRCVSGAAPDGFRLPFLAVDGFYGQLGGTTMKFFDETNNFLKEDH